MYQNLKDTQRGHLQHAKKKVFKILYNEIVSKKSEGKPRNRWMDLVEKMLENNCCIGELPWIEGLGEVYC